MARDARGDRKGESCSHGHENMGKPEEHATYMLAYATNPKNHKLKCVHARYQLIRMNYFKEKEEFSQSAEISLSKYLTFLHDSKWFKPRVL